MLVKNLVIKSVLDFNCRDILAGKTVFDALGKV